MATKTSEYLVLTAGERLAVLRDFVRAAEDELFRLELASPADPSRDERLKNARQRVEQLHTLYQSLMQDVESNGSTT